MSVAGAPTPEQPHERATVAARQAPATQGAPRHRVTAAPSRYPMSTSRSSARGAGLARAPGCPRRPCHRLRRAADRAARRPARRLDRPRQARRPARLALVCRWVEARPHRCGQRPGHALQLRRGRRHRQPDQDAQAPDVRPRQVRPAPQAGPARVTLTSPGATPITECGPDPDPAFTRRRHPPPRRSAPTSRALQLRSERPGHRYVRHIGDEDWDQLAPQHHAAVAPPPATPLRPPS
jgi:hypothetical protein